MKICPMCGADIFGADGGQKCSSCGAELSSVVSKRSRDGEEPEARGADLEGSGGALSESAPIKPADDLELVKAGHAFWTDAERPSHEDTDPGEPSKTRAAQSAEAQPEILLATSREPRDAPSLADLARARGARPQTEAAAGRNADEDTAAAHRSRASAPTTAARDGRILPSLDDTEPTGVRQQPGVDAAQTPIISDVTRSPELAFIDGNKLVVPGVTWASGQTVVVSGRTYQLRRRVARFPVSPREMLIGTGTFLGGILFAWMLSGSGEPTGRVFGVVQDVETGKLLAGVTVALKDKNRTTASDPSGMFYFDGLEGGIYTFVATDPIYGSSHKAVTVAAGATSTTLELARPITQTPAPPHPQPQPREQAPRPAASGPAKASASQPGKLAVAATVPNARVYLDGKLLGVGNAVYSGISPGRHKVEIRSEGFLTWESSIDIDAGEVTRVEPRLRAAAETAPVRLSAEEHATQGRKFIEARSFKLALEQFDAAVKLEPRAHYLAWRAEAHVGLKDLHRAEADFLQAIYLFGEEGQDARLDDLIERAVLVVPGSAALWKAQGDYQYRHRKLKDAEKSYRKALSLGGDKVAGNTAIGLVQYAGGSYQAALDSWNQADELSGRSDPYMAGYLALAMARLQYRASCRDAVRRLSMSAEALEHFRGHPDWSRVKRFVGEG